MRNRWSYFILFAASLLSVTAWAQAGPPQDRYIVVLNAGYGMPEDVAADVALRTNGRVGYIYETVLKGFSITMPRTARAGVARDPRIAYIEEDISVTIIAQTTPTGVERIFADYDALDIDGVDDYRVDVGAAVLDTGIDIDHSELDVVGGANCLQSSGGPPWSRTYVCDPTVSYDDDNSHGTHVAGTIGAIDNGEGVVGIAPGARLWAVKVLDSQGSGYLSGIIAGIDWTVANTLAKVINMSLSGSGQSDAMDTAIANAVGSGVTVVVAAGNDDADAGNYTPANSPEAITVSALADFDGEAGGSGSPTCRDDQDDTLADFSNWGTTVDIAAPGVCIRSTVSIEDGSYATYSGTSMASPHVAGAAALLASNDDSPATILRTLLETGNDVDWVDDSGDGIQEPLLDISTFTPKLIATGGGNTAPTASFTYSCTNLDCDFDGESSSDPDGDSLTYAWDFQSDDENDATGMLTSYTYSGDGTYNVTLTVTDQGSLSDSDTQSVTVSSSGTPDACDGLADGVHLTPSSTSQGRTWTAIVDAVNCVHGDLANFSSESLEWSPNVGTTDEDCLTSTSACQATQSEIQKKIGSVQFTLNDVVTTVSKN